MLALRVSPHGDMGNVNTKRDCGVVGEGRRRRDEFVASAFPSHLTQSGVHDTSQKDADTVQCSAGLTANYNLLRKVEARSILRVGVLCAFVDDHADYRFPARLPRSSQSNCVSKRASEEAGGRRTSKRPSHERTNAAPRCFPTSFLPSSGSNSPPPTPPLESRGRAGEGGNECTRPGATA